MAYSYDEILERMENKYHELTGHEPAECGDIGIRLKLLAGELYSLNSNFEWLKKQMLFTTATGEQLDMYAMQRGIKRIQGSRAGGELSIVLDTPLDYDMDVPIGTLCTTSDGSLNYVIDEPATIKRGVVRTICHASAEHSGKKYNVPKNVITTMVTYYSVGMYIENGTSFSGGTDDETDEELRERIAESYRNVSNGANAAYYRELAQSVDGVQSCSIVESSTSGSATIFVAGRGDKCTRECLSEVAKRIESGRCLGQKVNVFNANVITYNVDVSIAVKSGYESEEVIENAKANIRSYFDSLYVGQGVILAGIGRALIDTDGVENYVFNNMQDKSAAESVIMVLGNLTVGSM